MRLVAALVNDARLQWRNGFYYAAAFVGIFWIAVLAALPAAVRAWVLPAFILSGLLLSTYYFIAGVILLERAERSLAAVTTTPLRGSEYLAAKVLSLTALATLENLVIVAAAHGFGFQPLPLLVGIVVGCLICSLFGFVAVAPYRTINEYLMPSIPWMAFLSLPFVRYSRLWEGYWFDEVLIGHPLESSLTLMRAGFAPVPAGEQLAALLLGGLWTALLCGLARRRYRRYVVGAEAAGA